MNITPRLSKPTRPVLRWHGGKWKLAPWIISHFPRHRVYVEPFGGAASVLLRKERSYAEVYNDLDEEAVNLFRVLQEPLKAARLHRLLELTPFSRLEFELAYTPVENDDAIERARRLIIRAFMGHGSDAHAAKASGFRANSNKSGSTPAHDWVNYPTALHKTVERLRGVVVECRNAVDIMQRHDGRETLHYVDPPYLPETRSWQKTGKGSGNYTHELSPDDHARLLELLKTLVGMVVLSGYPSPLYDDALPDWRRIEIGAHADGALDRTEVIWINPACAAALDREGKAFKQRQLFEPPITSGDHQKPNAEIVRP
ncbi:MAG: DNA adenine methylase [Pseudolabrys sp.]